MEDPIPLPRSQGKLQRPVREIHQRGKLGRTTALGAFQELFGGRIGRPEEFPNVVEAVLLTTIAIRTQ